MSVIIVPKVIRDKFGEVCADAFVGLIKEIDLDARKDAIAIAEERLEKRLTEESGKINQKTTEVEGRFEKKLTEEIGKVNQKVTEVERRIRVNIEKLRTEIEKNKVDIIKWVFVFWMGQIGVLSAIIFAMLRFSR